MKITIYHNPSCSTSRKALAMIKEAEVEPEIIKYLDNPPTAEELDKLLKKLKMQPQELVRKKEPLYKELGLAEKELSREEWIQALVTHPRLIERPIVVSGQKAILGRPPENVQQLLEKS